MLTNLTEQLKKENEIMQTKKNKHAVALGRLGGSARTPAKAEASRRNGKLGGRPKKVLGKSQKG